MKNNNQTKFILIKSKVMLKSKINLILEVLSESLSIINYQNDEDYLVVFYRLSNMEMIELTNLLVEELFEDVILYESILFKDEHSMMESIEIVKTLLNKYDFNDYYLNNKRLVKSLISKGDKLLNKLVLQKYTTDKQMHKTIKVFLENNQNIKDASNSLYVHRNTLNQRISKFEETTSFNLKNFIDAYYIYQLIKN